MALGAEARTSADPRPALADLDALVDATRHGASLMDGMIHVSLVQLRDDAWLEAILRGVDPQPWMALPMNARGEVAEAWAGERMLFTGVYVQNTLQGTISGTGLYFGGGTSRLTAMGEWLSFRALWFLAPHDAAFMLKTMAASEDYCRSGGTPISLGSVDISRLRVISRLALPNVMETTITAVQAEQAQRIRRLAARLIVGWRASGHLPEDAAQLDRECQVLMVATALLPGILYERRSATAFRLATDPAPAATSMLPADRIQAVKPGPEASYAKGQNSLFLDLGKIPAFTPVITPAVSSAK